MATYTEVIEALKEPTRALRRAQPDAWKGFGALHQAAMADGEVPARTKELVALAIAVIEECDGCIAYHASAAARKGATDAEVAEILSVALLMGGDPRASGRRVRGMPTESSRASERLTGVGRVLRSKASEACIGARSRRRVDATVPLPQGLTDRRAHLPVASLKAVTSSE